MFKKIFRMRSRVFIFVCFIALALTVPVSAIDHWWTGAVSSNLSDPANWTDLDASNDPTAPRGEGGDDIVRIGNSWGSEDLNGNGKLDPGEDLNGNGVIDNPIPGAGAGYGGYYGGGGIDLAVDPVLSGTYVSRSGTAQIGWLFVLNYPNILTLKDGAYLVIDSTNSNLRNGGRLEVQGRSSTGGPSLITAGDFRLAENGAIAEAAHETSQIRINGTGYMQVDETLEGNSDRWIRIGTPDTPGTMPRGEIIIEENGLLEILPNGDGPYIGWGNADPSVNQIIIRGNGQLWLPGDAATMGRVGENGPMISLDDMIATGLIANDQGGTLTVSGSNPTVIKVSGVDNPSPAYGDLDVAPGVVLSWDPDPDNPTATYDVYFGTDINSVTDASRTNSLGVLVSQGQTETQYPATDTLSLEYGQSYYWRIDAVVNSTVSPGKLWYFAVEPFARLMATEDITATASSYAVDQGPEKTIDGSGLNADALHSEEQTDMWLSEVSEPNTAWIQYEFDKPYKLHQMLVWNYNGQFIQAGLGPKDVTITVSTDGVSWSQMNEVLAQAPGAAGYAANTTVEFGGMAAKMVRITAVNNWGNNPLFNQYGLSEVQFLAIPMSARKPNPESGAINVALDPSLAWTTGRGAVEHQVYFDADEQAVIAGTAPVMTADEATYSPSSLDLGVTYYWRVDEANEAAIPTLWEGSIWNFTTTQSIIIDGFETYNDDDNLIYDSWLDGYGNTDNGSQVGHSISPFAEKTIVHSGSNSMPLYYTGAVSQTDLTLDAEDWTRSGIKTLVIYFRGTVDNTGQLYVKIGNTKISYLGDAADIATEAWTAWQIDLASSGASLTSVSKLSIGVDNSSTSGLLYIDDVLLSSEVAQ